MNTRIVGLQFGLMKAASSRPIGRASVGEQAWELFNKYKRGTSPSISSTGTQSTELKPTVSVSTKPNPISNPGNSKPFYFNPEIEKLFPKNPNPFIIGMTPELVNSSNRYNGLYGTPAPTAPVLRRLGTGLQK